MLDGITMQRMESRCNIAKGWFTQTSSACQRVRERYLESLEFWWSELTTDDVYLPPRVQMVTVLQKMEQTAFFNATMRSITILAQAVEMESASQRAITSHIITYASTTVQSCTTSS